MSVGEPVEEMMRAVESSEPFLPKGQTALCHGAGHAAAIIGDDRPRDRHVRLRFANAAGPKWHRVYSTGTLNLKNAEFSRDKRPIEENCACYACREFSRGYIRHLIKAEEILGLRLITLHNLHFYLDLMRQAREQIQDGSFDEFRKRFVSNYKTHHE